MRTLTILNGEFGLSIFLHPLDHSVMLVYVYDLFSTVDHEPFEVPVPLLKKLLELDNAKS